MKTLIIALLVLLWGSLSLFSAVFVCTACAIADARSPKIY